MGKRQRREERARALARRRGSRILRVALVGVAVALAGGAGAWYGLAQRSEVVPVTVKGGPRLEVDRDTIDFGARRFEQWVKATFILRNVGDQPLRLAADPPVLIAEGC